MGRPFPLDRRQKSLRFEPGEDVDGIVLHRHSHGGKSGGR